MDGFKRALQEVRTIALVSLLAFLLIALLSPLFLGDFKGLAQEMVESFQTDKAELLASRDWQLALGLFKNNFLASLLAYIWGLVPFLFLPAGILALNALIVGGVFVFLDGLLSPLQFALSLLPHGIFEVPALVLAISLGIKLSLEHSKRLMGRDHEAIWPLVKRQVQVFIRLIVPLLILAALIEAFISPRFMAWLLA